MDFGRQTERPLSTTNAQIHLEPDAARSLSGASTNGFCRAAVTGALLFGIGEKLARYRRSLAATRRSFAFYVANSFAPFEETPYKLPIAYGRSLSPSPTLPSSPRLRRDKTAWQALRSG
jgi:hypothetical protein